MAREKRRHLPQSLLADILAVSQARGTRNAAANSLLSGLLSGQTTLTMLLSQLKAATSSTLHRLRRGEAFRVAPQLFFDLRFRSSRR